MTVIGWLHRDRGDEWLVYEPSVVTRTGRAPIDGFAVIADGGPKAGYKITEPASEPEELHRLLLRRSKPANLKV